MKHYEVKICKSLEQVNLEQWNNLLGTENPFLSYEFLIALEQNNAVGETYGWLSQHILLYKDDKLAGAMPLYLKNNSYGEFVFDNAWAEAYTRYGYEYFPKLVSSIPYTPITSSQCLISSDFPEVEIRIKLIETAIELAKDQSVSSLHFLFTSEKDTQELLTQKCFTRLGCQFHWHNKNYTCFDDYLMALSSKRRKQIKRERKQANDGIEIEQFNGHTATDEHWEVFEKLYRHTYDTKWGYATLNLGFYQQVAKTLPDKVLLFLAKKNGIYFAGAINFIGPDTLYGRNWGAFEYHPALHFELCYYRAIEYCIQHKLIRFEAGAQGEHKIARGFIAQKTYSAHWIAEPAFLEPLKAFSNNETRAINDYILDINENHSPYRKV